MKRKRNLIIYFIVTLVVVLTVLSLERSSPYATYLEEIAEERAEKEDYFIDDPESPLTETQKKTFEGLSYFPVDTAFRITAKLTFPEKPKVRRVQTSTGEQRSYLETAWARFSLKGRPQKLVLWENAENPDGYYFIAFTDETSARSTYGAGRYLDLQKDDVQNQELVLDFNRAYNPYCAYNEQYSCPLPPPENRITVAVTAGEKSYVKTN